MGEPAAAAARPRTLSERALARMWNGCIDNDPSGQILSAWIAKEELRALCATATRGGHRRDPRSALAFYQWCADAQIPELTTPRGDDRDLVARRRGVPDHRTHQRPHRGHQPADQAGETRRLRIPEQRELPTPSTVALHPANPPIVSEETDGARSRSKSPKRSSRYRSRMWQFISRPELRSVMGQSKSAFTWRDVLLGNKILLMSFKGVPDEAVGLACASFMQSLWDTIKATPKDNLSFLMLDEAAEFMDGTLDLQKVFQQARKHNIGVIMANQEMDQMPKNLERTTLNNARNKIAFNTFSDDANTWRREMMIDAANFQNLPKHEAIVRLMTPAGLIGQ